VQLDTNALGSVLKAKYNLYFATLIKIIILTYMLSQTLTPEEVVQRNLDFYNNRDIEGFMASFTADIALHTFTDNTPTAVGLDAIRKIYQELFDLSPRLRSTIIKRIVFANKVIDHESIVGRRGATDIYEVVLIYEVKGNRINRITAIRK
jgi:hypothetical protein